MKKAICLLLCFWLPLFFSAASYASTHMISANVQTSENASLAHADSSSEYTVIVAVLPNATKNVAPLMQAENEMPDDCPMVKGSASDGMTGHGTNDKTPHNKCQHCGFCASMALYPVATIIDGSAPYHQFGGNIAWVSSSYLSPADQRPPITL